MLSCVVSCVWVVITMASKLRRPPLFGLDNPLGIPVLPKYSSAACKVSCCHPNGFFFHLSDSLLFQPSYSFLLIFIILLFCPFSPSDSLLFQSSLLLSLFSLFFISLVYCILFFPLVRLFLFPLILYLFSVVLVLCVFPRFFSLLTCPFLDNYVLSRY